MRTKQLIGVLCAIFLVSALVSAGDLTLDEFIDTFDFSFNIGDVNTTIFSDSMADKDSDGKNETLILNLTTDITVPGEYLFLADVIDRNGTVGNFTKETYSAGEHTIFITLNTSFLNDARWNYTISAYNQTGVLVYRKDKNPTQEYTSYHTGIGLTKITDENFQNREIRINLSLDGMSGERVNITVFLETENFTIFGVNETTLGMGAMNVSILVDNETIKSAHYVGRYNVTRIQVGEKIFARDYLTAIYDYRDFAQTSYIENFTDGINDTNGDGRGEWLQLNATVNIKQTGTYVLDLELRDLFDAYVTNLTNTQTFSSIGVKTIVVSVNGTELYQSKINGPYLVSYARLEKDGTTVDLLQDAHITKLYSFDNFTLPPLSDVTVNMSVHFDAETSVSSLGINISNIGNAPAFNVFLDAFDNNDFQNTTFVSLLNVGDIVNFRWNVSSSVSNRIHTAIVDFQDIIEEGNESNNVVSTGNKGPVLDFIGNKSIAVNSLITIDVNANDPENDLLTYATNGSYDSFNPTTGLFQWIPTTPGNYSVLFNVTDGNSTDEEIININATSNGAPVLASIGNRVAFVDLALTIDADATDPNGGILTYGHNATFGTSFDPDAGIFIWTPNTTGNYQMRFNVTDGEFVDNESITIIVRNVTEPGAFPRIVVNNTLNATPWRGEYFLVENFENWALGPINSTSNGFWNTSRVTPRYKGNWTVAMSYDEYGNLKKSLNHTSELPADSNYLFLEEPMLRKRFTNFTIQVKGKGDPGPGDVDIDGFGIAFRWNETSNSSGYRVYKSGETLYLVYFNGTKGEEDACCFQSSSGLFFPGNVGWLRVTVQGSMIYIYNSSDGADFGNPVIVRDINLDAPGNRSLINGSIGIFANENVSIDEIMITEHVRNQTFPDNETGIALHTENLTGVYLYSSTDGANQTNVTFDWYNSGRLNFTQVFTDMSTIDPQVHHSRTNKGDIWQFVVTFCNANEKCRSEVSNKVLILNTAPVMAPLENSTLFVDHELTIDVNAVDPNGDPLTYGTNATFGTFDPVTGIFTWTPNAIGSFRVEFNVTDGSESDKQTITIKVEKIANEAEGRIAIARGINSSLNVTNRTIFTDQQAYIRYEDDDQKLGRFDKFVNSTSQRWMFNYNTSNEIITNMTNISNMVNIWERQNMTEENITAETSLFINQTKT